MADRKLIATWQIGPNAVDVYEYSDLMNDDDPDGMFMSEVRPWEIRIHRRCQGSERWAVLLHELVHVATHLMSIELGSKDEVVCDAVALTFYEALKCYLAPPPDQAMSAVRGPG